MRSSKSRSRGNKNRNTSRPTGGNIINRVFDSSGPDGKVRGTPQQIIEKYSQLHRDSLLSNDRVNAENFAQHAEHYLRMLAEATREVDKQREQMEQENRERQAERDRQMQADRDRQAERDREREANRERQGQGGGGQNNGGQNSGQNSGQNGSQNGGHNNGGAQNGNGPSADRGERPERQERRPRAAPQGETETEADRAPSRDRERAARLRAQEEAFNGPTPSMLLDPSSADQPDFGSGDDDGPGLVDTPESGAAPARAPRTRKPRAPKAAAPSPDGPETAE